ncbi:MAG: hypothetical protein HQL57_06415, partial [Magnetococcales bacterium]|nr:hypothetical protein [Magnetococcales bacterium]
MAEGNRGMGAEEEGSAPLPLQSGRATEPVYGQRRPAYSLEAEQSVLGAILL